MVLLAKMSLGTTNDDDSSEETQQLTNTMTILPYCTKQPQRSQELMTMQDG